MKRVICFFFALVCAAQTYIAPIRTIGDITGNAATHQLSATAVQAKWVQIVTLAANSAVVRIGDSSTSASTGIALPGGAGFFFPPLPAGTHTQPNLYDLSRIYYYAGNGDKLTVTYVQ